MIKFGWCSRVWRDFWSSKVQSQAPLIITQPTTLCNLVLRLLICCTCYATCKTCKSQDLGIWGLGSLSDLWLHVWCQGPWCFFWVSLDCFPCSCSVLPPGGVVEPLSHSWHWWQLHLLSITKDWLFRPRAPVYQCLIVPSDMDSEIWFVFVMCLFLALRTQGHHTPSFREESCRILCPCWACPPPRSRSICLRLLSFKINLLRANWLFPVPVWTNP